MKATNVFKYAELFKQAIGIQHAAKFMRDNGVPFAVARNFLLFGTK